MPAFCASARNCFSSASLGSRNVTFHQGARPGLGMPSIGPAAAIDHLVDQPGLAGISLGQRRQPAALLDPLEDQVQHVDAKVGGVL